MRSPWGPWNSGGRRAEAVVSCLSCEEPGSRSRQLEIRRDPGLDALAALPRLARAALMTHLVTQRVAVMDHCTADAGRAAGAGR